MSGVFTKATRTTDMYMPVIIVMNFKERGLKLSASTVSGTSLSCLVGASEGDMEEDMSDVALLKLCLEVPGMFQRACGPFLT